MNFVEGDPRWITKKFPGKCSKCNAHIAKGKKAYYFPRVKCCHCEKCGVESEKRFLAEVQDEFMSGGWS